MAHDVIGSGEFRATTRPVPVEIEPLHAPGTRRTVWAAEIGDDLILEGDILVEGAPTPLQPRRRLWLGGVVVYCIDAGVLWPERIEAAIAAWQARTPIRFRPREAHDANFVVFRHGEGCSSGVGMIGGMQYVDLDAGASVGTIVHEIGHVIGLWHEQSRRDRDRYVRIDYENIDPSLRYNFNQQLNDGIDVGSYDYDSIMHSPRNALALDPGRPTIVAPAGVVIGQRDHISAGDARAVGYFYGGS